MPDVDYVAVLHQVILALEPKRSMRTGHGLGTRCQQCVPVDRLRANEVLLEISVDGSVSSLCAAIVGNRPRAAFIFTHGEKADQPQQRIRLSDQSAQPA